MEMTRENLEGVFAPVVTPFDDDRIRFDWLETNLEMLAESSLAGYLALGTNGESKSLTEDEKLEVVRTFVRLKGDKVLMVGTGCESNKETIELTNRVAGLGADFASVITPHYFASRMNDQTLIGFYQEVADSSDIPVLIYNIPKAASGVKISVNAAETLSSHPNILGMKDSGGASVFSFLAATADAEFSVLAGSATYFLPAVAVGAAGGIVSLANCFPEICCQLHTEVVSGNMERARELHHRIVQANRAVSGAGGVAGVKAAMELAGFRGGDPRRPLLPIGSEQRQTMRSKLEGLGFLQ
jgi:4-hydroxy-2-oxoglutarate aldolase